MKKKYWKRLLVVLGILMGLILVGGLVLYLYPTPESEVSPLVTIDFPAPGQEVALGQPLAVQISARDEAERITKLELWSVKDGVFNLIEGSIPPQADHILSVSGGWLPSSPGSIQLVARAFSESGKYGEAAVNVRVVETEGASALEGGGEEEPPLPEGGFGGQAPGEGQQGSGGQPLPDLEDPLEPALPLGRYLLPLVWDPFIPDLDTVDLQIEALSFAVQAPYLGVYCYVALNSYPTRRVPDSGYFDTADQVHWNIADYLGGDNAVTIPVLRDQPLEIHLECEGVKEDNQVVSLGALDASHPPQDWQGMTFQAAGTGGEGFQVAYRINPVASELAAPSQLHLVQMDQTSYFHWLWGGQAGEIDGFRIYRDGILVAVLPPDSLLYPMPQTWMEPLCGEEYSYQVTAFREGEESGPSNPLLFQGAACDLDNDILQIASTPVCGGTARQFQVQYTHGLPPGSASLSLQAYKDGEMLPDFYAAHPSIQHGTGSALVPLVYTGAEPVRSDQIAVTMQNDQGQVIYNEFFDQALDWAPGDVDLSISTVGFDPEGKVMRVRVANHGCGLAGPSDLALKRESDGWSGLLPVPQIGPKGAVLVRMAVEPGQMDLWRGAVDLTVDPLDQIPESNEDNNDYLLGSARVKAVEFTKIQIENDHDRSGKGEWELTFQVSRTHNGVWEIPQENWADSQWGEGDHALQLSFPIQLAAQDSLLISVFGMEKDTLSPNDWLGNVVVYFSPDGSSDPVAEALETLVTGVYKPFQLQGDWGEGGEYAIESDSGDYTIYFRLVMDR